MRSSHYRGRGSSYGRGRGVGGRGSFSYRRTASSASAKSGYVGTNVGSKSWVRTRSGTNSTASSDSGPSDSGKSQCTSTKESQNRATAVDSLEYQTQEAGNVAKEDGLASTPIMSGSSSIPRLDGPSRHKIWKRSLSAPGNTSLLAGPNNQSGKASSSVELVSKLAEEEIINPKPKGGPLNHSHKKWSRKEKQGEELTNRQGEQKEEPATELQQKTSFGLDAQPSSLVAHHRPKLSGPPKSNVWKRPRSPSSTSRLSQVRDEAASDPALIPANNTGDTRISRKEKVASDMETLSNPSKSTTEQGEAPPTEHRPKLSGPAKKAPMKHIFQKKPSTNTWQREEVTREGGKAPGPNISKEAKKAMDRKRKRYDGKRKGGAVVKRVKLQKAEGAVQEGLSSIDASIKLDKNVADKEATTHTLTDFAYRETLKTGKKYQAGRKQTYAKKIVSEPRNMGLVRVKPDESKTRICPTFLRGMACTNERCTKRHDVPKEAGMPICSFFQRNGQCMRRETCPFRHVKVNMQRAPLCPTFQKLGFCDDTECLMTHVRENPSKRERTAERAQS